MKKSVFIVSTVALLAFAATILTSCSDDITHVTETTKTGIPVFEHKDSIPKCSSENKGEMIYIQDSLEVFYCANSEWKPVKCKDGKDGHDGKDGASCFVEAIENGYEVFCGETSVGKITNGTDGARGDDGISCYVKKVEEDFEVFCGEESMGVLKSGTDGSKGPSGLNGDDCTLTDNGDGTATQKCGKDTITIYKALCGATPYDPAGDKFCYGVKLYDKCNQEAYDVTTQQCVDGSIVEK